MRFLSLHFSSSLFKYNIKIIKTGWFYFASSARGITIICKDFANPHMEIYPLSLFESLDLYKSLRITFVQASKVKTFLFKKYNEIENA